MLCFFPRTACRKGQAPCAVLHGRRVLVREWDAVHQGPRSRTAQEDPETTQAEGAGRKATPAAGQGGLDFCGRRYWLFLSKKMLYKCGIARFVIDNNNNRHLKLCNKL